jgi:hypothetical protein
MNYDIDTAEGMKNSVDWTQRLFDTTNEGGTWMIPRSLTIVTIHKSKKEVHIAKGFMPDPSIKKVIKAMGWTIVKK